MWFSPFFATILLFAQTSAATRSLNYVYFQFSASRHRTSRFAATQSDWPIVGR